MGRLCGSLPTSTATRRAGQAVRARVLRPTLAGQHRLVRYPTSSTPAWLAMSQDTANGACDRMPAPPAQATTWHVGRWQATAHRGSVAESAGAGPIRGRPTDGRARAVLMRFATRAAVAARERGPEYAGSAAGPALGLRMR